MRVLVVGAGHNGLICACYLARAGLDVTVVEQSEAPGGGSRSEETIAGYRFDTHSVAHNIINMTGILDELALGEAGLEYREMDPFATAVFEDGRRVRFHRSVARTVASIAEIDSREARAYADFMADALPLVRAATAGLGARSGRAGRRTSAVGALRAVLGTLRRGPLRVGRELLSPYGSLLEERLPSDLTRAPVSAFAAHAGASPDTPGSAFFALWQAAYHLHGQWHAAGGAQALAEALVRRLEEAGGRLRCRAPVARIETRAGRVAGVALEDGERIPADVVVTALNPAWRCSNCSIHLSPVAIGRSCRPRTRPTRCRPSSMWRSTASHPTRTRARATGMACRATSTPSMRCAGPSPRLTIGDCTGRSPATRSRPRRLTRHWPRTVTTPSTWRARRHRSSWRAAGSGTRTCSSRTWSPRSSGAHPAFARPSAASPCARLS